MRLSRENRMLVSPFSDRVWRSTVQVNTLWLRLLSRLRRVSPTWRFSAPRAMSFIASSTVCRWWW
jgi:hypothetical protein